MSPNRPVSESEAMTLFALALADGRCANMTGGVVPGHEFVGEVTAFGAGAAEKYGLSIGDQVRCIK